MDERLLLMRGVVIEKWQVVTGSRQHAVMHTGCIKRSCNVGTSGPGHLGAGCTLFSYRYSVVPVTGLRHTHRNTHPDTCIHTLNEKWS